MSTLTGRSAGLWVRKHMEVFSLLVHSLLSVVVGGASPRFLVPQYEGGGPTDYYATRREMT